MRCILRLHCNHIHCVAFRRKGYVLDLGSLNGELQQRSDGALLEIVMLNHRTGSTRVRVLAGWMHTKSLVQLQQPEGRINRRRSTERQWIVRKIALEHRAETMALQPAAQIIVKILEQRVFRRRY